MLALGLNTSIFAEAYGELAEPKKIDGFTIQCDAYQIMKNGEPVAEPNFCAQRFVNAYKKFTKKDVNMGKDVVFIRLDGKYFAAINLTKKSVTPFPYLIGDKTEKPVKDNWSKIRLKADAVCTVGNNSFFLGNGITSVTIDDKWDDEDFCLKFERFNDDPYSISQFSSTPEVVKPNR